MMTDMTNMKDESVHHGVACWPWLPLATELLEERYQGAAGVHVSLEEGGLRFSPVL